MKKKKDFAFFRSRIRTFQKAQWYLDLFAIASVVALFFHYLPIDILNSNPATGGDTGSHFWPLYTLVKQALPHWQVRVWNPGNLGGEPHLTHYFPLPYLIMAVLSLFMPLGRAFNIGTILPVGLFPICVYFCFRGLKTRFPIPLLAMVASLSFLYNESFSMWGGNAISTLAGQFAHVYAFDFFLLGLGSLNYEFQHKRWPLISGLLFAAVLLSHFYVALMLPIVFIFFLLSDNGESIKWKFHRLTVCGFIALGLSAWFVIPMLHNSPWNTAFGLVWGGDNLLKEVFPGIFWPFAAIIILISCFFLIFKFKKRLYEREWRGPITLCLTMFSVGVMYYFIFPKLGLVDVRVIPALQMLLVLTAALYLGLFLRRLLPLPWIWFLCVPILGLGIFWAGRQVTNFPGWMRWNYSGWESKSAYSDLQNLSDVLRGDFSDPRVIYENNDLSNSAGTIRVFEMLPYFAGRSVLESVYMQATILAPAAFYLQALISKTPSCPFPNYQCTSYKVESLKNFLDLMGISQIITVTPEVQVEADKAPFLQKQGDYGIWHLYKSKTPISLVGTLEKAPTYVSMKEYKQTFYDWFREYIPRKDFVIAERNLTDNDKVKIADSLVEPGQCHPKLHVEFDQMKLTTDCPGKFHYLKFAFHPTFKTSTGDALYLTSPGFIGIIPSQNQVTLTWGQHWLWTLSDTISWLCALALLIFALYLLKQKRNKT